MQQTQIFNQHTHLFFIEQLRTVIDNKFSTDDQKLDRIRELLEYEEIPLFIRQEASNFIYESINK